jgi:uncharacterized membrane protein
MFASDDEMWRRRLHPHVNMAGHAVMSISLAYFSFAIPWQWRLYFCKGERQAVKLELVIHHVLVVLGILTYLLTSVCAVYGAVAFACMEFTNWFFVPYTMMSQIGLDDGGARYTAVGVLLVVSFIVCRIGICTWQGVEFSKDLAGKSVSGIRGRDLSWGSEVGILVEDPRWGSEVGDLVWRFEVRVYGGVSGKDLG